MPSQLVEALTLSLMQLVLEIFGIPILQSEVDVLQTVRVVGQVIECGRPEEDSNHVSSLNYFLQGTFE